MSEPLHPCRIMPTRECPPSYCGDLGDHPCARYGNDGPAMWGVPWDEELEDDERCLS